MNARSPSWSVQVKGSAITSRLRYLGEHGADQEKDVLGALALEHRAIVKAGVIKNSWVPFSLFVDLNVTIDEALGKGDLALCRELGAYGARVNLPTIYRLFYKVGSFGFILRRAARIWDIHYSSGKLTIDGGDDWAKLRVEDFAVPHKSLWLSVMGWAEASAVISGVTPTEVELVAAPETPKDGACEIMMRW